MSAHTSGKWGQRRGKIATDSLTGLLRGGEFTSRLERQIQSFPARELAVLVVGLDRFDLVLSHPTFWGRLANQYGSTVSVKQMKSGTMSTSISP